MPVWIADIVAPLLRYGVAILAGWLVKLGVEQADATAFAAGLVGVLVPLVWAIVNKRLARQRYEIAKSLPAGATDDQVTDLLTIERRVR